MTLKERLDELYLQALREGKRLVYTYAPPPEAEIAMTMTKEEEAEFAAMDPEFYLELQGREEGG